MKYRIADKKDFFQLALMRWDFTLEGKDQSKVVNKKEDFINECVKFFNSSDDKKIWTHWIAETDNEIVSHISINHIRKVPKPNLFFDEMAYITNVYTKHKYRNNGIGSELMDHVNEWAIEKSFEVMIVWPSNRAVNFYKRKNFRSENDIMEQVIRPDA